MMLPILEEAVLAMSARRLRREAFLSFQSKDKALDLICSKICGGVSVSKFQKSENPRVLVAFGNPRFNNRLRLCSCATGSTSTQITTRMGCAYFFDQRIQNIKVLLPVWRDPLLHFQNLESARNSEEGSEDSWCVEMRGSRRQSRSRFRAQRQERRGQHYEHLRSARR